MSKASSTRDLDTRISSCVLRALSQSTAGRTLFHFLARSLPSEFLKLANREEGLHLAAFFFSPVSFLGVRPPSPSLQQRAAAKETSCHLDGLAYRKIAHLVAVLSVCLTLLYWFHWLNIPSSYTTLEQLSCLARLPLKI